MWRIGGNPLACAAGMVVADAFDKEGLLNNVVARGAQFRLTALHSPLQIMWLINFIIN